MAVHQESFSSGVSFATSFRPKENFASGVSFANSFTVEKQTVGLETGVRFRSAFRRTRGPLASGRYRR